MKTRLFCAPSVFNVHCNPTVLEPCYVSIAPISTLHGYKEPKLAKPLTDTQVRTAKPTEKIYTLPDGAGMYLEVATSGAKIWRMQYEKAEWRIPGEKMKMGHDHLVPLSTQAVEIFRGLQTMTGHGRYVFPASGLTIAA